MTRGILFLVSILFTFSIAKGEDEKEYSSLMRKGEYDKVIKIITEKALHDSVGMEDYFQLGRAYQNMYNHKAAIEAFGKGKELGLNSTSLHMAMGNSLSAMYNKTGAISAYSEALANDSTNVQARLNLAKTYYETKDYYKALSLYADLAERDSINTYYLTQIGLSSLGLGRTAEAAEKLQRVLELDEGNLLASLKLGKIYFDSERFDETRDVLEKSVAKYPNHPSLNKLLSETYFQKKNYEGAVVGFSKAISFGDSTAGVYQKLGFCYYFISCGSAANNDTMRMLKLTESFNALYKSYLLDGTNPLTPMYLGIVSKEMDKLDQAIFYLEKSLALVFPDYLGDIFTQLGATHQLKEDYSEAIKCYHEALEYNPEKKLLVFYLAAIYDKFYADRAVPMMYYKKFLRDKTIEDPALREYAKDRIERITEEIHFHSSYN